MSMPTNADYQDAIQNPRICFCHPELQQVVTESNKIGLPRPYSGAFAVVFPVIYKNKKWAIRCFSTYHPDQELRYEKISQYLKQNRLPYMVDFDFLKQGIKVKGDWYPILKMEWVKGDSLNRYLEKNIDNPQVILNLANKFVKLIADLRQYKIAHGDLQHGNIIIVDGNLYLVDYDGMYVPGLDNMKSNELGHKNYQHPRRTSHDFGPNLDNFSAWSIYTALIVLCFDDSMRCLIKADDDHLLFRRLDIENPDSSIIFRQLESIKDARLGNLLYSFRNLFYCSDISEIPPLETNLNVLLPGIKQPKETQPISPFGSNWVIGHLTVPKIESPIPSIIERVCAKSCTILILLTVIGIIEDIIITSLWVPFLIYFIMVFILTQFLYYRYRSQPIFIEKKKILSGIKGIQDDIKNIKEYLSNISNTKNKLEQDKIKQEDELSTQIKKLSLLEKTELSKIETEFQKSLSTIGHKKQNLIQLENQEFSSAINNFQSQYLQNRFSQFAIKKQSIDGIGPEMKKRLINHGINTAADINDVKIEIDGYGRYYHEVAYIIRPGGNKIHIDGIGPIKAQALLAWKKNIEATLRGYGIPSLPSAQGDAIKSKYLSQRKLLDKEESDLKKDTSHKKTMITQNYKNQKDSLQKQLENVPSLFLKDIKELENKYEIEQRNFSGKRYNLQFSERKLKSYQNIKFFIYLKHAFM